MSRFNTIQWSLKFAGRAMVVPAFVGAGVVLMMGLAGQFSPKVSATVEASGSADREIHGREVAVRRVRVPRIESSVGTIRAVHETTIGSKLLARVIEAQLKAGQNVREGDVLVRLDDADLQAKLKQARAAVTSAEATHAQALRDEKRNGDLLKSNAVSRQEFERMATAVRSSEAELHRAEEVVNEVQVTLEWATVRAPMDGTVIDKRIDVGDLVRPGQVLVTMFDPKRMQLVASVRESLTHRLEVGQSIGVEIEGIDKQCTGTISEIVPEAQVASRAFQVKVTGPCPAGIYTGMFGRVLIPLDEELVLVLPRQAVRNVGQLELVDAVEHGRSIRRTVRTGRVFADHVEVLSGLQEGEQVIIASASAADQESSHD
jgi:RND family efflux transporter MFP subunit